MTQAQVRRVEAQELEIGDDDALAAGGIIDQESLELHLAQDFAPGDLLFQAGDGSESGTGRMEISVTDGTSPNDMVVLYTIKGMPRVMTRVLAEMRLGKRYPARHIHRGKRVFYPRPPVPVPEPTLSCDVPECNDGRGKSFHTQRQMEKHTENRHPDTFKERERARERDLQERQVLAAERQSELMERILAGGGSPPAGLVAPQPEQTNGNGKSRGPLPKSEPSEDWKPDQLRRWVEQSELPLPEGHETFESRDWMGYIDGLAATQEE